MSATIIEPRVSKAIMFFTTKFGMLIPEHSLELYISYLFNSRQANCDVKGAFVFQNLVEIVQDLAKVSLSFDRLIH